jgi:hypothetical protein
MQAYTRTNCQVAYNAGRDMYLKGWEKSCPYTKGHIYARCWYRGWYDAERKNPKISSG